MAKLPGAEPSVEMAHCNQSLYSNKQQKQERFDIPFSTDQPAMSQMCVTDRHRQMCVK